MRPKRRQRILLVLLAVAICAWAAETWRRAAGAYRGYEGASALVIIPQHATGADVARILRDSGVIRDAVQFRLLARLRGVGHRLQAGEYLFDRPMTPWEVLDQIARGEVLLHRVTFPEGLTGREVIERLAKLRFAPRADLEKAFRDAAPVARVDGEARDLEGYLFPDTYQFARGVPAKEILEAMVGRFREVFDARLEERARGLGLTVRQAVTLASLIEKETSVPGERARVSAVFHNRLRAGMPLQCDPTVIFALASAGRYDGDLSRDDLEYASPYNTYVNPGLPPGPIASPGRASLEAAVSPDPVQDMYFVADGTGGHHFSTTLQEHLRAVARYRRLQKAGA